MKTSHASQFRPILKSKLLELSVALGCMACLAPVALPAQIMEIRVEGTIKSNLANPGPQSSDSNIMGYERIWAGGMYQTQTASPYGFPTASQPLDVYFNNKSYIIAPPFVLNLSIDTRLLPTADLGSGPVSTRYSNQTFSPLIA